MSHPIYADPNAIYKLLNEIEQLREQNAELLAAVKEAHEHIGSLTVVSPAIAEAFHVLAVAITKARVSDET